MSLPHVVWKPQCWVLHSPQEIIPSSDLPETERASDGRLLSTNHCLVPKGLETALQRMDFTSVHGIIPARILESVAIFPPGDLPDSGIEPVSLALAGGYLPLSYLGSFKA